MKKTALTLAISSTFFGLAFAGPEPLSSKEIVPQPAPPPPCFNGWYIGIHGAVTFEEADNHTFVEGQVSEIEEGTVPFFAEDRGTGDNNRGGFGGVHLGRNFQFGAFVLGLEADISLGTLEKDGGKAFIEVEETLDTDTSLKAVTTSDIQLNWYTTVRPRLGYVFWNDRVMAFATGGFAAGQADFIARTDIAFDLEGNTGRAHLHRNGDEDVRTGWTVGGGFEFCVAHNVLLNLMYLYIDLGNVHDAETNTFGPINIGVDDSIDFARGRATSDLHYHVFQAGVSFKF
jgi:outer membrane immunogenic protein